MAIRFRCRQCNRLLGIASRKAGTEIGCPQCGSLQTVPSEEAAAAAMAMGQSAVGPEAAEPVNAAILSEDDPPPLDLPQEAAGVPPAPLPKPPDLPDEATPEPVVVFPRRTLYLQGLLFLLVALAAFAAGYWSGRGDASVQGQPAGMAPPGEMTLVEGRVVFDSGGGMLAGDEGAVVIALSAEQLPEETLSIQGLRPQDPPPGEADQSVAAIEKLGGAYGRADAAGAFSLVLPRQSRCRLLIISRKTVRPGDDPIDELDLDEIRPYFYRAADLVGRHKYRWSQEWLQPGGPPITHSFGRDEGKR